MRFSPLHRTLFLTIIALVCAFVAVTETHAQVPVRTRRVQLYSNNNTNTTTLESVDGQTTNWTLTLPPTQGSTGSLLVSTVSGSTAATNWLIPGANGSILTLTGGTPTWESLSSTAWVLAGNSGTDPVTDFLGTTDAEPLVIRTDDTERLRITETGNLALATTTALERFTIGDGTQNEEMGLNVGTDGVAQINFRYGSGLPLSYIQFADSDLILSNTIPGGSAGRIVLNTAGPSEELYITNNGLIGINESNPINNMHITINDAVANGVSVALALDHDPVTAPANGLGTALLFRGETDNGTQEIAQIAGVYSNATNATRAGYLTFSTVNNGSALTERVRVNSTGELGVGLTANTGSLFHVAGTAGVANVRLNSLSGAAVATAWTPTANDGIVVSDNNGDLLKRDVGSVGDAIAANLTIFWRLSGNATTTAWNGTTGSFLGTTSAQPLSIATTNATAQDIVFYSGANGATERLRIAGTTGAITQTGTGQVTFTGNVDATNGLDVTTANLTVGGTNFTVAPATGNTAIAGTLDVTGATTLSSTLNQAGNAVLASTAGSSTTIGNATGAITLSGTALTPNVTVTNLGGTAKTTIGGGFDRIVLANNAGLLEEASINTVIGSSAWALAGNATTTAWNGTTGSFLGTTSAQPLSIATTNATAQDIVIYTGANGANERLRITGAGAITQTGTGQVTFTGNVDATNGLDVTTANLTVGGTNFTVAPATGNTAIAGTLDVTGATTLSSTLNQAGNAVLASTAGSSTTIGNATGAITLSGTALTPNVTVTNLGGTAKTTIGGGFDRIVLANNTGLLEEASINTVIGSSAWALLGNATTTAWNGTTGSFLGTTSAQPLSIATTNATAQDIVFYSGANGANERLRITGAGAITQTGTGQVTFTGNVDATNGLDVTTANLTVGGANFTVAPATGNTSIAGTLDVTGATTLSSSLNQAGNAVIASTAGSTTTIGNTTGAITLSGTALTPNVTVTNLGGTAKTTIGGGFDRIVLANNAGLLEEASINTVIGSSAWALSGNATTTAWNGTTGSFLGTTSAQPLSIATTNATAQDIVFYSGANGATERLRIAGTTGAITQTGTGQVTFTGNVDATNGLDVTTANLTVGGTNFTVAPATGNTAIAGTLDVTGATTLSSTLNQAGNAVLASTAGSSTTIGNATGAITLSGTALTPNVTVTNLGGTAKTTIGGGFDRIVLANNTGLLEEASINTVIGSSAWALAGNATTTAWNGTTGSFLGTTSAQPLSIATTNATAQDIVFYSGANGATERLRIAGTTGAITQTGTGAVTLTGATTISNTLNQTGNAVLASTAGSTTTIGNATGAITLSGTALTPNVTVTSLGGTAKTTVTAGYDRIVIANNTGSLEEASISTVVGSTAWLLGGNTLAAASTIGSNNNFQVAIKTNNTNRITIAGGGAVTISSATTINSTLNTTGNTVIASGGTATATIGTATGLILLNGTAGGNNVRLNNLGGTAKTTIGAGFDRIVLANNTGVLEEASIGTVIGSTGWLLTGNSTATATDFVGPTTNSIPLNLATAATTPGNINFYIGTVVAANLRAQLTNSTFIVGDGANNVATTLTGTLSQTDDVTLASAAGAVTTLGNTTGQITLNGTSGTANVRATSLASASATPAVGTEGVVMADNNGDLRRRSAATALSALGIAKGVFTPVALASSFTIPTTGFDLVAGATITITVLGPTGGAVHAQLTNITPGTDQFECITSAPIDPTYQIHWIVMNP